CVVYPVHLNPLVRQTASVILGGNDRIQLIEPLDVVDFHNFAARSHLTLTDSGGVQEEAPSLGVPVLVLRGTTGRPEAMEAGTLPAAGTDEETIFHLADELLSNPSAQEPMARAVKPYGEGEASRRTAHAIVHYFKNKG